MKVHTGHREVRQSLLSALASPDGDLYLNIFKTVATV